MNWRILAAWPNWFILPAMAAFWIVIGVLMVELLAGKAYHSESE